LSDTIALCYHGVSSSWRDPMAVTPEQLHQQVGWFLRRGYRAVTVREAISQPSQGKRLVITFDDALLSVHSLARPVLERLGAVATVYAPSVPIAEGRPMSWPEVARHLQTEAAVELTPMTPAQLREAAGDGWEIGSHTRTHPWLPRIADAELAHELVGSKRELEQLLDLSIETLAYPFGAYDQRVADATAAAGYAAAVTLPVKVPAWPRDPDAQELMTLPRIGIYRVDEWRRFRVKVARPVRALRAGPLWDLSRRG
jgi:peptidoglycan/xylan/chitin deacetylase (PgdA/CDA1 family)